MLQHEGPVVTVSFSPDGQTMMTGSYDSSVRLWDTAGRLLGPPLRQGSMVQHAAFRPDGRQILVGVRASIARLWDLAPRAMEDAPARRSLSAASTAPAATTFPLAVSPDGRTILTQGTDLTVQVRDAATNLPIGQPLPHQRAVLLGGTSVLPGQRNACSSDRRRVLTVEQDTVAKLWDVEAGRVIAELKGELEQSTFFTAAFSPDGRFIVTGNFFSVAYVWDAETGKQLRALAHEEAGPVFNVAFGRDRTLLTCGADYAVRFWNVETGEQLGAPLMHHAAVFALALSPDGTKAVTGDVDRNVQIWDVPARRRLLHLTGHEGGVHDAAFSRDGRFVLTGSRDRTARLWDVSTGKPIGPPLTHARAVIRVAYGQGGRSIMTATDDQVTHSWQVPTAMNGTAEHLELWTQVVTSMELEADGGVRILDGAEWAQRRRACDAIGLHPGVQEARR
jgi:WD40 repeat protein